jgi:hypothetical protein
MIKVMGTTEDLCGDLVWRKVCFTCRVPHYYHFVVSRTKVVAAFYFEYVFLNC